MKVDVVCGGVRRILAKIRTKTLSKTRKNNETHVKIFSTSISMEGVACMSRFKGVGDFRKDED